MKNAFKLLILALSLVTTGVNAGITEDAMCSTVFILVADFEDNREDTNTQVLAYYDTLAYMIAWEQDRLGVSVAIYKKLVEQYKKDMNSATWLLNWRRCVNRAIEIYPTFIESRQ